MIRSATLAIAFLAGIAFTLFTALETTAPAQAANLSIASTLPAEPTQTPEPTATAFPILPAGQPTPAGLGWPGVPQCLNCSPMAARVKLSTYDPRAYDPLYPQLNCWDFSEIHGYCLSPVWIGVPWESLWGFGAACPVDWPVGTWVEVPNVGNFICFDHGEKITCDPQTGVCNVDLLAPSGQAWQGQTFDAMLWVPRSWLIRFSNKNQQ